MIVEPDFLDHWKTLLIVELLDDDAAPLYLIRLWAHCQNRKQDSFQGMTPAILKAICRYQGEAQRLWDVLLESGWIEQQDGTVTVHDFRDINSQLFANWENGKKGGRKPKPNPSGTQRKPNQEMGSEWVNPSGTDREDKSREDKSEGTTYPSSESASGSDPVVVVFPVSGDKKNREWGFTKSHVDRLAEIFPGVDVPAEARKALGWVMADLKRTKTARGMPKFLFGWMERNQNKGRGSPAATASNRQKFDLEAWAKQDDQK